MRVRFSTRIPSSSGGVVASKVTKVLRRALLDTARPRIAALVVSRASAAADKLALDFAPRYRTALKERGAVEVTEKAVVITVTDPVVVAVERGSKAFDMKAKLLARGKPAKGGGVYVDVPFRHKPGSVPQAIRTAGRRAARSSGGVGQVRLPAKTIGRAFTRELHRGPIGQALGVRPRKQSVWHQRGIHDDLIRTARRRSSGSLAVRYSTIRRISSRSAASSWWHPGFKARHVLDGVLPGARREIAGIIREALASARED